MRHFTLGLVACVLVLGAWQAAPALAAPPLAFDLRVYYEDRTHSFPAVAIYNPGSGFYDLIDCTGRKFDQATVSGDEFLQGSQTAGPLTGTYSFPNLVNSTFAYRGQGGPPAAACPGLIPKSVRP
jgi:hypothetical protein